MPDQVTLENTYWELVRVGDTSINTGAGQREPHLVFQSKERRVSGFTGCNQMAGGYTRDGQDLSFSQLITTKMACLGGGMATETALTAALQRVHAWSISGQQLTLSDASGQPLAVFDSRGPIP